jgi:hypothetical protein
VLSPAPTEIAIRAATITVASVALDEGRERAAETEDHEVDRNAKLIVRGSSRTRSGAARSGPGRRSEPGGGDQRRTAATIQA